MQRTYEVMFIVRPDIVEEDLEKLISTLEGQVGTAGGTVKSIERMGKRRLAYIVRKFREGIYILFTVESEAGQIVREIERRLRVTEPVIKFITVRVDEEQKRLDKVKLDRASRQRRQPAPPVPAPIPVPVPVPVPALAPVAPAEAAPDVPETESTPAAL